MRILLDTCFWGGAREALAALAHDVAWIGEEPADPGDVAILRRAHEEGRTLVTLDKDFGELAVVRAIPHSGITRLVGFRTGDQVRQCQFVIERHGDELARGAIVTVEPGRIRIRPADEEL